MACRPERVGDPCPILLRLSSPRIAFWVRRAGLWLAPLTSPSFAAGTFGLATPLTLHCILQCWLPPPLPPCHRDMDATTSTLAPVLAMATTGPIV